MKDREIFGAFADELCGNAKGWRRCPIAIAIWKSYDREGVP